MKFLELAEKILNESDKPLTPNEIWESAVQKGLDSNLESKGKTPWATLAARLCVAECLPIQAMQG